ncbi:MAG: diguanylate cyclase [Xanthobacteraceae bacterium]
MPVYAVNTSMALDIPTLFVVATCVTAFLGLFLLFAWMQDRVRALAWWGTAYLIGGFSVVVWALESHISPPLPAGTSNALVFVACGMIWNAARLFHGRPVLWGSLAAGAILWLIACMIPEFAQSAMARIVLSSVIVSVYTFLTAAELWRERRRHLLQRWPAIFVPILHGAVFLCPIPLASMLPDDRGVVALASGWIAVFGLEVMLYIVGTAFIILVLSKERTVRIHKTAAMTDELTGILNRRGFYAAALDRCERQTQRNEPISVLMFDLDHFKRINDRFGHAIGDEALRLFAATVSANMRASDIVGRFGGEEFVAILPGSIEDAAVAAGRVRAAFEAAAVTVANRPLAATVSIGAACGAPGADLQAILAAADEALYRAKSSGRNCVALAEATVRPAVSTADVGTVPATAVASPQVVLAS